MPTNTTAQIDSTVQNFVAEITNLVRVAALEAVAAALGGGAPARRGPGRPRGSGRGPGRPRGAATGAAKPSRPARGGRRARRSTEDLQSMAQKFLAHVKGHDGQRLEEIGAGLGIDTAELKRPAQMLLAAKAVKTSGAKRGTRYHLGTGSLPSMDAGGAPKRRGKRGKRAKKA